MKLCPHCPDGLIYDGSQRCNTCQGLSQPVLEPANDNFPEAYRFCERVKSSLKELCLAI